jgi:hypothetical protein
MHSCICLPTNFLFFIVRCVWMVSVAFCLSCNTFTSNWRCDKGQTLRSTLMKQHDAHRNTINTQYVSRLIMISVLLLKYLHMEFRLWCSGYEACRLCLTNVNCTWSADYYLMLLWLRAIPIGILISIWFDRQLGFDAWFPARRMISVIWSGRLTHLHLVSKLTIFFLNWM